jgi:hypothetical protein
MYINESKLKKIGEVGVDAGCVWIGDPCYVLHKDEPYPAIGKNWSDFCEILDKDNFYNKGYLSFGNLGACISTAYGDGSYPIYIQFNRDGRPSKIVIDFEPTDEDEEIYDSR